MFLLCIVCFFLNNTATTEIYPFPLHDPLPIWGDDRRRRHPPPLSPGRARAAAAAAAGHPPAGGASPRDPATDRKSTRLNSSHANISYAVFCLKKKKKYTKYFRLLQH